MAEVVTILLAAGLSRRMGARNKLLLPVGDDPMITHVVRTYEAATDGPIIVVTGHEADKVALALHGTLATPLFNPSYADGQMTSVVCGLRAAGEADLLLIGLGDQPHLQPEDLETLLAAHRTGDPTKISIPQRGEDRGNPIVVPGSLRARLLADPKSPGCKTFTRAHPDEVQFHALPARGFYADVDTPEDYAALSDAPQGAPV